MLTGRCKAVMLTGRWTGVMLTVQVDPQAEDPSVWAAVWRETEQLIARALDSPQALP